MVGLNRILVYVVAGICVVAVGVALPAMEVLAQGQGHGPPISSNQSTAIGNQNDAGSGQDAGDSIDGALSITDAQRTWKANLTPAGSDSDWFELAESSAYCAVGSVTTQSPGSVALSGSGSLSRAVRRPVDPHEPVQLVLAAPGTFAPHLGILPPTTLMAAQVGNGPPSPGSYTFGFTARTHAELDPDGDGESPEAGATPATSAALPPECTAGRLDAIDIADRYHFDVADVRDVTLSFAISAGGESQLRVLKPDGSTFATISSGGVVDVWADIPGRWSVVVERPASSPAPALGLTRAFASADALDSDYLLGFSDGPDPEACRPTCVG